MGIAAACAHAMSSECAVAMERGAAVYRALPGSSQAERNAYAVAAPRACAFDGMRIRGLGGKWGRASGAGLSGTGTSSPFRAHASSTSFMRSASAVPTRTRAPSR
jgi:hypothetical protein